MSLHPDHPALKPIPDFKAYAVELSRQLIISRAASQERRLSSLNNQVWQAMQPEIKNISIGK